ncbi:MAG: D-2-hydroxyacid dehydrogenase [Firmicutes bacterium]|nr:D-2-hydroxyacid dehydrogenase [Bacillota bacterium]
MTANPSIFIYYPQAQSIAQYMRSQGYTGEVFWAENAVGAADLVARADIIFAWKMPPKLYAKASRLRWIQCLGAGVEDIVGNPLIPSPVIMTRIVDQFGAMVAEYVLAELLYRVRHLSLARRQQQEKKWQSFPVESLAGKTIGIAGVGSIGREVAQKARAFSMIVYGLSRHSHTDAVDSMFRPSQWMEFVQALDYLVLTLPLTAQTRGIVDQHVLHAMKRSAVLVNVGRGALIAEQDLLQALQQRIIAGAVLDVFEEEPLPADHPLWILDNVMVTPHISGPNRNDAVARFAWENLQRFLRQEPLCGLVARTQGY